MRYEDFVIQIATRPGDGYAVKVLKSPAGEGVGDLTLPLAAEQLDHLLAHVRRTVREGADARDASPGTGANGTLPGTGAKGTKSLGETRDLDLAPEPRAAPELTLEQLGDRLYRAVFSNQIRTLFDQSRGSVGASEDVGLRIKLKLDPGDRGLTALYNLPWEYLCRSDTQDFLSLSRASPIVRYLDVPRPAPVLPLPPVLRILVVISSPGGLAALDLEQERHNIETAWGRQDGVEVVFLERASIGALREALLEKPCHVVHFMGHGGLDPATGDAVLYFEAAGGGSDPVSGHALATKLKDFGSLGLIFLNACNTARTGNDTGTDPFSGVASALVLGGLPAVLAMQFPISDQAAIDFSGAFYRRLAAGDSVDEALTEGRQAVHSANPDSMEWGTPVLFVRVPDGTIFQAPPEEKSGGGSRKRLLAGAAAAVLLTLSLSTIPGIRRVLDPAHQTVGSFQIDASHDFETNVAGLAGHLASIDLLPDGRMRLNFEFTNTTDRDVDLDFHLGETYLADDLGNRYGVLDVDPALVPSESLSADAAPGPSTGVPAGAMGDTVPAGQKVGLSLDFPAPRQGAQELNVALASDRQDVEFEFFQVGLPEVPESLAVPEEPFVRQKGSEVPEIVVPPEGDQRGVATFGSDVEGFDGKLSRVELLNGQRMRWDLEFFNRSAAHRELSLRYDRIYLTDEDGNYYKVLDSSTGGRFGGQANAYRGIVQRAVKVRHWLEFSAPIRNAKRFMLVLAGADGGGGFRTLEASIPKYGARYSVTPAPAESPPGATILEVHQSFDNTLDGLASELTAIELLADGRMRWRFAFHNRSQRDLQVGFNYPRTYLADASGHRYGVRATDTPAGAGRSVTFVLRRGLRTEHWMEFDGPRGRDAGTFSVWLFSHDHRHLELRSFKVGPLSYPPGFPVAAPADAFLQGSTVLALGTRFDSNIVGLEGTLKQLELLLPGRMRLHFELFNRSPRDLEIGFDYALTLLRNARGTEYPVLGSDTGASSGTYKKTLQRAVKTEHWLEFSTPSEGERTLRVDLIGHRPRVLDFPEITVTLDLPKGYAPASGSVQTPPSFVLLDGEHEVGCSLPGLKAKLTTIDRLANGRLRWSFELVNQSPRPVEIGFVWSETYLADDLGNTYKVLASDAQPAPDTIRKVHRTTLGAGQLTRHWFEFSGPVDGATTFIVVLVSHDASKLRFQPLRMALPERLR